MSLLEKIQLVNKLVDETPETLFDQFSIQINRKSVGQGLRNDLTEEFNKFGRINELASHAEFQAKKAKSRRDSALAIALVELDRQLAGKRMGIEAKKSASRMIPIMLGGEPTSVAAEEERMVLFEYLSQRGKDKVKEMSTMIDLGRSLLSFDKTEIDRSQ